MSTTKLLLTTKLFCLSLFTFFDSLIVLIEHKTADWLIYKFIKQFSTWSFLGDIFLGTHSGWLLSFWVWMRRWSTSGKLPISCTSCKISIRRYSKNYFTGAFQAFYRRMKSTLHMLIYNSSMYNWGTRPKTSK